MMKKLFLGAAVLLGMSGAVRAQSFTLTIDAGYLKYSNGTTNVPVSGLLELIASPSGTFSTPSANSFITGDNVLVASFGMNYGGGTGEVVQTLASVPFTTTNYTVTAGESLLLRFYPTLTYSATQNYRSTGPGSLTTFGQVRSSTTEFPTRDVSETAWVVPAAGAAKDITYITVNDGGTYADGLNGLTVSSFASFAASPVPEPSSYAMFACGLAALIGLQLRHNRAKRLRAGI